ncbi:hypothetical protein LOTGIDRAFT_233174 [Lottia gigantea]|uniref:Uncharacterized protein n=1 Tax=Lottia gigantea TaxID=225164 RepID=V4A6T7_LOTGI|nr:hypothetical protein LOTGIDRAFT_233174 [Lottia gigantea]ESO92422.1 hypothetical protein LOTGIDRAFT_233174 [Lottia gigantea]
MTYRRDAEAMDFDIDALNRKMRMVDPNDVLDMRERTASAEELGERDDSDNTSDEATSPPKQTNKYISLITKYQALFAIMPFLSLHSNPCFLKAAKDFVKRLALTSHLIDLRKKLPSKACITCDGFTSPSRGLSPERKKKWTLPLCDKVLPDFSTLQIYEDTIHNFSSIRISNESIFADGDTCHSLPTMLHAPQIDEECYGNYVDRREAEETLVQQSMAEQISDYVTFPAVTSKYKNRENLTFHDSTPTNVSRLPIKYISQNVGVKKKFLDLNRLYRQRQHQRYRKKHMQRQFSIFYQPTAIEEDPDITIQNTVNFCMNMSSPIKSESLNQSSEDLSD